MPLGKAFFFVAKFYGCHFQILKKSETQKHTSDFRGLLFFGLLGGVYFFSDSPVYIYGLQRNLFAELGALVREKAAIVSYTVFPLALLVMAFAGCRFLLRAF